MKKKLAVLVMGLTLPLWGWLAQTFLSVFSFRIIHLLVFVAACGIWGVLAFFAEDVLENTTQAVLLLNLPLWVILALFCVNVLAGPFLPEGFQNFLELCLLPVSFQHLNYYFLYVFTLPAPFAQILGAAFLLAASITGCKVRRDRWMGTGV